MGNMNQLKVKACYYYPVKSCAGISVDRLEVTEMGPKWDRNWMFINAKGGMVSMRTHYKLALITPKVSQTTLTLLAPEVGEMSIPLEVDGVETMAELWGDQVLLQEVKPAREWISDYLGEDVRLVQIGYQYQRQINLKYSQQGEQTSLSDGFPLLITSVESLTAVNEHLNTDIAMKNFRPNLVVAGGEAFEENNWSSLKVGSMTFKATKMCARCIMICVDQSRGVMGSKDPLRVLNKLNKVNGQPIFGQNLIPTQRGVVQIEDMVNPSL